MFSDDRDRLFEQALARRLRVDAGRNAPGCLDPEVLAAYHERMLSPEEMADLKTHLVSCLRCQEILARLEATQDIPEKQNRESELVLAGAASPSNADKIREEATLPAAPAKSAETRPDRVTEFRTRKISVFGWVAPAGAIAAGLLLWVGIRGFRPEGKRAEPPAQIAENRRDASQQGVSKQEDQAVFREPLPKLKLQPTAPPTATLRDETQDSFSARSSRGRLKDDKALSPSSTAASPAPVTRGLEAGDRIAAPNREKPEAWEEKSVDRSATLDSMRPGKETQKKPAKPEVDSGVAGGALSAQAPAPPPPAPLPGSKTAQAAVTSAEVSEVAPAESLSHLEHLNKDANQPAAFSRVLLNQNELAATVAAPGRKSVWRFGEHGAIAHSGDGGKSWESQSAALTANLTSGSAPSAKVCWIAGTNGALLRTVDGGKHWQLVTTPISADLGGVHADDAKHATIWDLPNRLSYETSDGGVTWKPVANK
jgi:hypothetical protein